MKTDTIAIIGGAALALFVLFKVVNKKTPVATPSAIQKIALDTMEQVGLDRLFQYNIDTGPFGKNPGGPLGMAQDFGNNLFFAPNGTPYAAPVGFKF